MEQIAVKVHHFRIYDYEPKENDFSMTIFINSDGQGKADHDSYRNFPNFMPIREWRYHEQKSGRKAIHFWFVAGGLDIIESDQLEIATPFFEKYLKHLYQPLT